MSKQDTIISLLKEINENIDNVGGGNVSKVKVSAFKVTDACINDDGIWEGEKTIDTSECTSLSECFSDVSAMKKINVSNFNTQKVTSMYAIFNNCTSLNEIIGLENWDTSNVTNLKKLFHKSKIEYGLESVENWNVKKVTNLFSAFNGVIQNRLTLNWDLSSCTTIQECFSTSAIKYLDLHNCNVSNISNFIGIFNAANSFIELDITGWDLSNATTVSHMFNSSKYYLTTLIGGKTECDVISNNISTLIGLKLSIDLSSMPNIDRASLRAVINGLADLTGQTAQTLTLGTTLIAKLTEEDIAIATVKNWTIA